ncbi:LAME_0G10902g1_1 [Lachancea meyersii CBS 8951]|uniref:LAME_0G10902g1_1 n=1 Tax=Lachancea meyersii CBS 8951 TaxID=1266667 RepID=A0A1G4K976_9SACH|nr:LAME_0G10902g1_1 [Lachancea meyersii CBS 8951]
MTSNTARFTYELILNALPIKSGTGGYLEVESEPSFISCRLILFNLATTYSIDAVIEESMRLIDIITKEQKTSNPSEKALCSLTVLLRLLSDIAELCWKYEDSQRSRQANESLDQEEAMSKNDVGFATQKSCFHVSRPRPLESSIAQRLIQEISRLKLNFSTMRALRRISSSHISGQSNPGSSSKNDATGLDDLDSSPLLRAISTNLDYLSRFAAAANPSEFLEFIDSHVLIPLVEQRSCSEVDVIPYLDFFSAFYITTNNLPSFLQNISKIMENMKKSAHQELVLMYAAQAIMTWILSRPHEYVEVINEIRSSAKDEISHAICRLSSSLFDDVHSNYNVSYVLTTTVSSNAAISEFKSSPPSSDVSSPISSSGSASYFQSDTTDLRRIHTYTRSDFESQALSSGWDFFNSSILSGALFQVEDVANLSILRFLVVMLLFQPSAFEEMNMMSFKHIPNEAALSLDEISKPIAEDEKKKPQNQFSKLRPSSHRKLQNFKFPSFTSTSRKVKFLTTLVKNINGSQIVSDTSLLDTLRVLVLMFRAASAIKLADEESPAVTFCKRLLFVVGDSLQLCNYSQSKKNPVIARCLSRNPTSHTKLQIAFFPPALILEPDSFLTRLNQFTQNKHTGYKHLRTLTEGFKIFFSIPNVTRSNLELVLKSIEFFRVTLAEMSDVILAALNHFSEGFAANVEDILEGSLKSGADFSRIGRSFSPPFPLKLVPTLSSQPSNNKTDIVRTTSSSSVSSGASSYNENNSISKSTNERPAILAPRARRPSGSTMTTVNKVNAKMPLSSECDKTLYGTKAQFESVNRIVTSPLRFSRSMELSESNLNSLIAQSSGQNSSIENSMFIAQNLTNADLADARLTMVNIFSVYKRTIQDYFVTMSRHPAFKVINDYKILIKPLFVGLVDDHPVVQASTRSFSAFIATWAMKLDNGKECREIRLILYKGAAYLVTLISSALFNLDLDDVKREQLLDVTLKYMDLRSELIANLDVESLKNIEEDTHHLLHGSTGRALFASLVSHEPKVHKLLRACFRSLLRELDSHAKLMGQDSGVEKYNLKFFNSMCKDNYVSTGAVAFQRRLRSEVLKYIEVPDKMLFDSLKLMYSQWLNFIRKPQLNSTDSNHFRNIAGFIASSCGPFLTIDQTAVAKSHEGASMQDEVIEMIDFFISRQCTWLNDPNLLTRENSKDIVSTELHPLAFKYLFKHLKKLTDDLESLDLAQAQNETSVLLLEQIVLIVRTALEREDAKDGLILVSVQVLELTSQIFKVVENVNHSSTRYYKAIMHLSKMLKSFENTEHNLCVSGVLLIKNQWLRSAISWFKSAIFKELDLNNLSRPHREMSLKRRDLDYLYIDTSIESSKALAYITKDLMLEVPLSISEGELKRSKAVTFGNYFSILLKGLERTATVDAYPSTLRHKIGVLNDNIITSLTNLLNANVDVGLRYALPIGYSKNQGIKVAFLRVFVEIISNFDIQTTKATKEKSELVEQFVVQSLSCPQLLPLVAKVCPANDIDSLASSMLTIYEVKNASHLIVMELIKQEIQAASRYADVLRRNSCATRTLSMFSRLKGSHYLKKTLQPALCEIIANDEDFEIEKITLDHPEAEKHVALFTKYLGLLIDSIVNSVSFFPPQFFLICQSIYLSVKEKFPGYETVAVGSFVFLRFFCPALVSPDSENLVDIVTPKHKRAFVTLAKVIQNIANGSINSMKWPVLKSKSDFLKTCGEKVSVFLAELARPRRIVSTELRMNEKVTLNDFNFLHRYLYQHGLEARSEVIDAIKSQEDLETLKEVGRATDVLLWTLGQPRMEFRNVIPAFIRERMDDYPELYEFMSRHSLRTFVFKEESSFIHEAVSSEGLPMIVITLKLLHLQTVDAEVIIYRTFQVYSKVWSSKHYIVIDCSGFDRDHAGAKKLATFFLNLIPDDAARNCVHFYYYNMSKEIVNWWLPIFKGNNPYLQYHRTIHHFINSDANPSLIKSLKLTSFSNGICSDVRVTLRDVSLYDHEKGRFTPVTMKIGNKHLQMISETPFRFKVTGIDDVVEINYNNVYEVGRITSTIVSFETGVPSEFTINFDDGNKLVLCSSKYLEIIKIFYYVQARIEEDYDSGDFEIQKQNETIQNDEREHNEVLSSLLLVIYAGLCSDNEEVKNISYNILAASQEAFGLDFECKLRISPEVHVPHDTSAFCYSLFRGLAKTAPELSLVVWKSLLEGLSGVFEETDVPHVVSALSPWAANLYKYVYLADDENGPENVSYVIRTLIKLSVKDPKMTMMYSQCIWSVLILEADLVAVIVDEIVNHSLDRDSEGGDWKNVISLITRVSTVEMCSEVINRILSVSRLFLPSLKMEASTNSWSELIILVNITVALFFDSLLLAQLFLPEVLYIVSLLIDVGPSELRLSLHKLLMNACQSLSTNDSLSLERKNSLDLLKETFSRQKMRFMSGFSQDKGRILQNFSASSFLSKFTTLEHFISSIVALMETSSETENLQWKAKYNKYIMDAVFNVRSFLSAKAAMITGIIGQNGLPEYVCRNMLLQTIKAVAEPYVSDELTFLMISHCFTYSKIVLGLQPSSILLRRLFWLAAAFIQSPNTVFYHGGILFIGNTVKRITTPHENEEKRSLKSLLYASRGFAEPLLVELESMGGLKMTMENLPYFFLNSVMKGLLIPHVKSTSVDCLCLMVTLAYRDLRYEYCEDHLCYFLIVYQVLRPSKLSSLITELQINDELHFFDEHNFVTKSLLRWMELDSEASLIALYQASVYFAAGSSDELSKTRYLLLIQHLVRVNPMKVIRIYSIIRPELNRIAAFDAQSDFPQLVLSIVQEIVKEKEYAHAASHLSETHAFLKSKDLSGIGKIDIPYNSSEIMTGIRVNPYAAYESKKLTVQIMFRMMKLPGGNE